MLTIQLYFTQNKIYHNCLEQLKKELKHIQNWFNENKLSLNTSKTNAYSDRIPLIFPKLTINNEIIKRERTMKFLGVLLNEKLIWKHHINCIQDIISKNLGVLYKARIYLNEKCLKQVYFSFNRPYLNYGNISWVSTSKTKLKHLLNRQKHASLLIFYKDNLQNS